MPVRSYLPSVQFVVIVSSIALSGGLVMAAQYITNDSPSPSNLVSSDSASGAVDWKVALYDVQGVNPLEIQSNTTVQASLSGLLQDADVTNVTNSVGRSLLLNLSEAKSQGLGGDIPTQEKLLAEAAQKLKINTGKVYAASDLTIVADSNASIRTYGNAVIEAMSNYPRANMQDVYVALGTAVDANDPKQLDALVRIGTGYQGIMTDLLATPVPQTLSPLHLRIVNNFSAIAASFTDMKEILTDPLRGFAGVQAYNELAGETSRVLTSIAQSFTKNAILFTKDEPGSAWSLFLP